MKGVVRPFAALVGRTQMRHKLAVAAALAAGRQA
jgi:hypothetical protein